MILETEGTVPPVRLTNPKAPLAPKALMALILVSIAVLMACGGDASGPAPGRAANIANQSAVPQSADVMLVVSLTMDDYLGSTVVLYFSFPG